jgi:hypothetical protein
MPYRELTMIDIKEVLRRWSARQSLHRIARETGVDGNTVRRYVHAATTWSWPWVASRPRTRCTRSRSAFRRAYCPTRAPSGKPSRCTGNASKHGEDEVSSSVAELREDYPGTRFICDVVLLRS